MYNKAGWVEVIVGCMGSGKSLEFIARVIVARLSGEIVQVFCYSGAVNTRFGPTEDGTTLEAIQVKTSADILTHLDPIATVVAIDEAMLLDMGLVDVVDTLARMGLRVIVAGCDLNYREEDFGAIPRLMARAEEVVKLLAVCAVCLKPIASRTQRYREDGTPSRLCDPEEVLDKSRYKAVCRQHYKKPD